MLWKRGDSRNLRKGDNICLLLPGLRFLPLPFQDSPPSHHNSK